MKLVSTRPILMAGVLFCGSGAMGVDLGSSALDRILRPSARMPSASDIITNHVAATPAVRPNLPNAPLPSMLREAGV